MKAPEKNADVVNYQAKEAILDDNLLASHKVWLYVLSAAGLVLTLFHEKEIAMFSRIATAVLMIAVLGGCVSQGTYNKEVSQVDTLSAQNKTYQALNAQLQSEIQADQVRIKQLEGRLTVTLIDEIVFNSGSAEMNAKGRSTLEKIVGTLQSVTDKRIVVQGFTDNEPIGPALRARYPSNWELSTARASDVVRFLQAKGIDPKRLEASGFGEYQPVAPNNTVAGRRENRRIDIVLMDMKF